MIVADKKPIEEIIQQVEAYRNVLILGCNECVTVCEAGGKKEVGILASALRMYFINNGKDMRIDEITLERQCDHEYLEEIRDRIDKYDAVVSLACGVGVQFMAEKYLSKPVFPGRQHLFPGCHRKAGALDGTVPGLRPVHSGQHGRHLPGFAMRQTDFKRPLRRLQQGQV